MAECSCTWKVRRHKPAVRVPATSCEVHSRAVEPIGADCCGCNCTACHSANCCKD